MNYVIAAIGVIAIIAVIIFYPIQHVPSPATIAAPMPIAIASFQCDGGKAMHAAFFKGETRPATIPGGPPTPGGSVLLALDDGRTMTLKQTISADGARYSDGDPMVEEGETFVFWSKGYGALVLENNEQKTYVGCIEVADDPGNLPQAYESGSAGFSIRYPDGFTVDPKFQYQEFGPGKEIAGVKFTVPTALAEGTNLSQDSYLSVEEIPNSQTCVASMFLPSGEKKIVSREITDGDMTYSVASSTDAAAGNRYEETIFAFPGTNPCIAVRYLVHYGVFENYAPGMVKEFDREALLHIFDDMRHTMRIIQ